MIEARSMPLFNETGLRSLRRLFEILPGFLSWLLLSAVGVFAFFVPIQAALVVILFHLFWLFRLVYMTLLLVLSYAKLDQERNTNWLERCRDVTRLPDSLAVAEERVDAFFREIKNLRGSESKITCLRKLRSEQEHLNRLRRPAAGAVSLPQLDHIFHLIILPNYREDIAVLRSTLAALREANYPLDRMIVVLSFEEREGEAAHAKASALQEAFLRVFYELIVTFHPAGLPGEQPVKGANATWAAKQTERFLADRGIPYENVLVSCFDADTCVSREYFGCLSYNFLIHPDRLRLSFQPIPVYHNNIWEVPAFARIMETGSSFYQLIESANPDHLVTFSSHSMSFHTLVQAGYWPVDMISDDSAIFWRCFLHCNGAYRTVPLHVTLSMSIVTGKSWLDTFRRLYVQKRRWAWGIENFPMVMEGFIHNNAIPWLEKAKHGFKMLENHVSWATWGFIVTFLGWLPVIFGGREYGLSVVSYNLPKITQMIFHLAGISLAISIILSLMLLPKRPAHVAFTENFAFVAQWLLLPLILPFLLALPALDAQTRLLMGRHISFDVTSKVKRSDAHPLTPALSPLSRTMGEMEG